MGFSHGTEEAARATDGLEALGEQEQLAYTILELVTDDRDARLAEPVDSHRNAGAIRPISLALASRRARVQPFGMAFRHLGEDRLIDGKLKLLKLNHSK
jgi:hypothetical protein